MMVDDVEDANHGNDLTSFMKYCMLWYADGYSIAKLDVLLLKQRETQKHRLDKDSRDERESPLRF
jgi:hypothetical protein